MAIKKTTKGWLVDIRPTGRDGQRVRKVFALKETAQAFERDVFREQERLTAGCSSDMSVLELLDKFRDTYASVRMRSFEVSEKYKIQTLRKFFELTPMKISRFSLGDAERYIAWRKEVGCKLGTINREINLLKRIFSWTVEGGLLPFSPLARLKHLKGVKARCRWLSQLERNTILNACREKDPQLAWPVFLALETGFRLANVEALEPNDVTENFITAKRTKSGEPYQVPISDSLRPQLNRFLAGELKIGTRLSPRFRRIIKVLGLYGSEDDPEKVTFHTLRHSFAAYWLQRGVPIYTVSQWMGHASVKMTESVYAHLSQQHHVETMKKFSDKCGQNVDTQIIQFPEKASVSSCPQGESNPCFGLERNEQDKTTV